MTTSRMTLATVLFGSLALPALAQPHVGVHQVRPTHHRVARHAPVHRIAATPEAKAPATVAAVPKPTVTAAPLAQTTGSVVPPAAVPGGASATVPGAAPAATPRVTTSAPAMAPALPGAARTN